MIRLLNAFHFASNRSTIDKLNSVDADVAASVDPYKVMAALFNDRSNVYINPVVEVDQSGVRRKLAEVPSHMEEYGDTDEIYERVKDIDPMNFNERDAGWIKEKFQVVRTWLYTNCRETVGFYKSGEQDAENLFRCFSQYCANGGHPTWCDAMILTPGFDDFFTSHNHDGKDIGDSGRDSGAVGADVKEERRKKAEAAKSNTERSRKKRRLARENAGLSPGSSPEVVDMTGDDDDGGVSRAVGSNMAESNALQAAAILINQPEHYQESVAFVLSVMRRESEKMLIPKVGMPTGSGNPSTPMRPDNV